MSSITLFILFVCIIAILFLVLNLLFAPHNPYAEKFSSFECGFHSFLGQNRSQFNVKFFVFGLLFLLFDLEITLIFPFAVSQSNNEIYGLIVVLLFMIIITLGFVYELGKGALKIDSKQNIGIISNNRTNTSVSFLGKSPSNDKNSFNLGYSGGGGVKNIRRLHTHSVVGANFKRLYSTSQVGTPLGTDGVPGRGSTKASQGSSDFWKQVNSSKLDEKNPFFLVNRFLKDFPNTALASSNLTCSFINSILSSQFKGFELSCSDFDLLMKIAPIRLELPVNSKCLAPQKKYIFFLG
uniref:NADH-ubiquinone oxidoreductase chain 3 n=1 Tax=Juglanconis sp. TaxID=2041886 RepID=A0A291LIK0_9PEZI|nr:NADH dehydrogenase subunit 3 [Juglanconis sp.]